MGRAFRCGSLTNSIRIRLATLGSFGKWAVRHGRLQTNPLDELTRPPRKKRLPAVPKWEAIEKGVTGCAKLRDPAILALLWSAPHFSAHREELSVRCSARYSAGLRIPSAECGAWVL